MINSEVKEDKDLIEGQMDQTMEDYSSVSNQLIKKQSKYTPVKLLDDVQHLQVDKAQEDDGSTKDDEKMVHQFDKPKKEKL